MGIFEAGKVDKRYAIGCSSIIVVVGIVGWLLRGGLGGEQSLIQTGQQTGQQTEGTNDCFIPKQGGAPCIRDMVGARFEWTDTGEACKGIRVAVETDQDLETLDPQIRGEVVMQVHPKGETNDGSADTGVGIGRYSDWMVFRFGPGGTRLPEEIGSAQIGGKNVILQLNSFHDGSCITEDSQLRVKLQFDDSSGNPIYDILGFGGGLMEYHTIKEYEDAFGSR